MSSDRKSMAADDRPGPKVGDRKTIDGKEHMYVMGTVAPEPGMNNPAGSKPTNPKDLIGTDKVPLSLVPGTSVAYQALGHLEGHLKYGKTNWRVGKVKFTIYIDAMLRHIEKLLDGEWADQQSKVPHLSSILASAGIIVDAYEKGVLVDDRPIQGTASETIDRLSSVVKHLRELHADKNPKHYTHEGPIEE